MIKYLNEAILLEKKWGKFEKIPRSVSSKLMECQRLCNECGGCKKEQKDDTVKDGK